MKLFPILLFSLLLSFAAYAENSTKTNGYTIHHNALTTDTLSPKVANAYGIQRSKNRGMVNISVIKDEPGTTGTPVTAEVELVARNLLGQERDIPLREIREETAIYYIADFPVGNREQLVFKLEALPAGSSYALSATFQQEFFTD
jgi:hypothetical protein